MSLSQRRVENGLINEQREITRRVAAAVSHLAADTPIMVQMAAWLYDKRDDPNSDVAQEDIDAVGVPFQAQLAHLKTVLEQWVWIDQLNDADPAVAAAARASIDALNEGKSPLEDRYK